MRERESAIEIESEREREGRDLVALDPSPKRVYRPAPSPAKRHWKAKIQRKLRENCRRNYKDGDFMIVLIGTSGSSFSFHHLFLFLSL